MSNEITSTHELAESEYDGHAHSGPQDVSDIVATKAAEGRGIEFHVSMRDYTQRDMESLIIEAAARVLVGEYGNNKLAKLIEERCIALTIEKVDKHLAGITAEIIEQPVTPKFPSLRDEKPATMREFIGLTGRAYLQERVDRDGRPSTDSWGGGKPRIQHLVEAALQHSFKTEIERATNAVIAEVKNAIAAHHKTFLEAEKARFRDAMAKVVS